eukprot:TRINITY_DN103574_c0_g1_i1.p1 TRINITY_DN103574_c0_g1~~TRINITY_DN103574_c0_g1_i1.p1  ORF type:complete len:671 (-),score=135.47 TRINITY_DN103574_c0_g1_i1:62-2023(-)
MEVDDPLLLRVEARDKWREGSALEVFSNSDQRWCIGWVIGEEEAGQGDDVASMKVLRVLYDEQAFKSKLLAHHDSALCSLGTHIRRMPPQFDVVLEHRPGSATASNCIRHRVSQHTCHTLEDAWSLYYQSSVRSRVQLPLPAPMPTMHGHGGVVPGSTVLASSSSAIAPLTGSAREQASARDLVTLSASASTSLNAAGSELARLRELLAQSEEEREAEAAVAAQALARVQAEAEDAIGRLSAELTEALRARDVARSDNDALRRQLLEATRHLQRLTGGEDFSNGDSHPATGDRRALIQPLGPRQGPMGSSRGLGPSKHSRPSFMVSRSLSAEHSGFEGGILAAGGAPTSARQHNAQQGGDKPMILTREALGNQQSTGTGGLRATAAGPGAAMQSSRKLGNNSNAGVGANAPGTAREGQKFEGSGSTGGGSVTLKQQQQQAGDSDVLKISINVPRALTAEELAEMERLEDERFALAAQQERQQQQQQLLLLQQQAYANVAARATSQPMVPIQQGCAPVPEDRSAAWSHRPANVPQRSLSGQAMGVQRLPSAPAVPSSQSQSSAMVATLADKQQQMHWERPVVQQDRRQFVSTQHPQQTVGASAPTYAATRPAPLGSTSALTTANTGAMPVGSTSALGAYQHQQAQPMYGVQYRR